MSKNIINYNDMFSMSDYSQMKLQNQYQKLFNKSKGETAVQNSKKEAERFYNLSLIQLFDNLINRLVGILNDLVEFINNDRKSLNRLLDIFTYKDRMIYVGIFMIIISILLFFISVTS